MTTILIASAAALVTIVLLVAELLLVRRTLARDLAEALERARYEIQRAQTLGELASSIDLHDVMARTVEAARLLPGVDAAVVTVATGSGDVVAADGPAPDDATVPAVGAAADGRLPKSVRLSYTYDAEHQTGERPHLLREGLVVPLASGGEHVGQLAAYSRTARGLDAARAALEELAQRAAPVLENARRFREARQLADLDALTGLHNQRYFHETLAREVARARRYNRSLALIVLDLDDFKLINDRVGHLTGDAVLAEAAERVRDAVRTADIACRVGGDEFAVILPESTLTEANQLYERISAAVAKPVGQGGLIRLSAGVTELRPDDDAITVFQRADEALYRAKDAGKATVVAVAALPTEDLRPLPETASGGGEA